MSNKPNDGSYSHFLAHYEDVNTFLDPIYGYIIFTKHREGEGSEEDIVDSAWMQRLRRIHQLQSAWWVFPSAEHSRFQHSIGVMHLAGQFAEHLYGFLADTSEGESGGLPSREKFVETARISGLLHDVGHGPFGHFFDNCYLRPRWQTNHEAIAQTIILAQVKPMIESIRRSPGGEFLTYEQITAGDIAYLIKRPDPEDEDASPKWLLLLRSLFSGLYTADNLDYVCRDAYMTGVCSDAVDITRLLYYSHVQRTSSGDYVMALHRNGLSALRRFLQTRFYMYDSIYNHRTVRAIEIEMEHIFNETVDQFLGGNPLENLDKYLNLDEWSLISKACELANDSQGDLGKGWQAIIGRNPSWKMAFEKRVQRDEPPDFLDLKSQEDGRLKEKALEKKIHEKLVRSGVRMQENEVRVDIVTLDLRPERSLLRVYDPETKSLAPDAWTMISAGIPARAFIVRVYTSREAQVDEVTRAASSVINQDQQDASVDTNI